MTGGSVYNYQEDRRGHGHPIRNTSIYGKELGEHERQRIAQWRSDLDNLAEGSQTSQGLDSSTLTAASSDLDSDEDMAFEEFTAVTEKAELHHINGKVRLAEKLYQKALEEAKRKKFRSQHAGKHNSVILKLAVIHIEQKKFAEAKRTLSILLCQFKADLPSEITQQMITGRLNLAKAHLGLNELPDAERICREAMGAWRRTLGKENLDYQSSLQ